MDFSSFLVESLLLVNEKILLQKKTTFICRMWSPLRVINIFYRLAWGKHKLLVLCSAVMHGTVYIVKCYITSWDSTRCKLQALCRKFSYIIWLPSSAAVFSNYKQFLEFSRVSQYRWPSAKKSPTTIFVRKQRKIPLGLKR